MKVLLVPVGKEPEVVEIDSTLEAMQALLGKNITLESVRLPGGSAFVSIFCDENGRMKDLPKNRWIIPESLSPGGIDVIRGDFFLSKIDEEGAGISLTDSDISRWSAKFALSQSKG